MPLQLTRQQQLLQQESMRRERPARSARTALRPASVAGEGKGEKRHVRQAHCGDPEMNAEAEGESCRARSRRTSTRRGRACRRSCTISFCELHTFQ